MASKRTSNPPRSAWGGFFFAAGLNDALVQDGESLGNGFSTHCAIRPAGWRLRENVAFACAQLMPTALITEHPRLRGWRSPGAASRCGSPLGQGELRLPGTIHCACARLREAYKGTALMQLKPAVGDRIVEPSLVFAAVGCPASAGMRLPSCLVSHSLAVNLPSLI